MKTFNPMNTITLNTLALVSATLVAASWASAQSTPPPSPAWSGNIVYSSTFNVAEDAASGPFSIGMSGWGVYSGSTAQFSTVNTAAGQTSGGNGTGYGYIQNGVDEDNNPIWKYAGPIIPGATRRGFLQTSLISGTGEGTQRALVDTNAALNLDLSQGQYQISFDAVMSSTQSVADLSVMLRIGEQWFVSTTIFKPEPVGDTNAFAVGNYDNYHKVLDLTGNGADWQSLTLIAGTEMSLGDVASADLDLSDVTGIGIYITKNNSWGGSLRLDSVVITQVPEPTTVAALVSGAALAAVALLRRRRRA